MDRKYSRLDCRAIPNSSIICPPSPAIMPLRRVRFSNGATNLYWVRLYTAQYALLTAGSYLHSLTTDWRRSHMSYGKMMIKLAAISLALCLAAASASFSAPLPKPTQEMLKKLKLDPALLSDIDRELDVPKAWLDGANKERKLRVFSTIDPPQAEVLFAPFKERYPFIATEYNRASHEDRAIRTLIAYKKKK